MMSFCRVRGCECAGMCFREHEKRIAALESRLTEECAKRQATEGLARNLRIQLNAAEEGQTLALQAADKAERELAEAQRQHATTKERLYGTSQAILALVAPYRERAENAEARVGEYLVAVSKAVYPGATKHPAFDSSWILTELANTLENYRERVAELQAFVDAATRFEYGSYGAELDLGDKWTVLYQDPGRSTRSPVWVAVSCYHERDEAIAHARDLAAKEKEPT